MGRQKIFSVTLFSVVVGFFSFSIPLAWAESYLTHIQDVPLPTGYSEDIANSVVFDAPGGRVITQHAFGNSSAQDVETYYTSSLPALGWAPHRPDESVKSLTFIREGEMLVLEIRSHENRTHIQFHLTPKP